MITLSICLLLVILALIAAVFSQLSGDAMVLPADRDLYFPPFFKSEGFYRSFLINLSFAGIATAAGAIQSFRCQQFWTICDPLLAVFLNLFFGLLAALCLRSGSSEITSKKRWTWAIALLAAGLLMFCFAVCTTVHAAPPQPDQTASGTQ